MSPCVYFWLSFYIYEMLFVLSQSWIRMTLLVLVVKMRNVTFSFQINLSLNTYIYARLTLCMCKSVR